MATWIGLALTMVSPVAACTAGEVSPLPVQSPGPAPHLTTSPTAPPAEALPELQARVDPGPSKSPGPRPASNSACWGAITHDLDVRSTELALVPSMCFATGGILRVIGLGPGELTVAPTDLVSSWYEAAVTTIRFIRPGTVTVTIPQQGQLHAIAVVVR